MRRGYLWIAVACLASLVVLGLWVILRDTSPSTPRVGSSDAGGVPAPPLEPALAAPEASAARPINHLPAAKGDEEVEAMGLLRELMSTNPAAALELAARLDGSFPHSELGEERASLVIDALVKTGDIGRARANSEAYFARFPRGRFGRHIETLTGAHPHPTDE